MIDRPARWWARLRDPFVSWNEVRGLGRAKRAKTNAVYFISPPGGIFVPILSISASGYILSGVSGARPVVAGSGWSTSGFAAAAGLSDFSAFRGEWSVP